MTTLPIDNAAMVTFRFRQTFDSEDWQFGVKTVVRDSADWADLLTAALGWVTADNPIMERTTLTGITYSEWGTSGFEGFHQQTAILASHSYSSGNQAPPQCAAVVSLLNTSENTISIKRRRGRIYFGQLAIASLDADGLLTTTYTAAAITSAQALDAALASVPGGSAGGVTMDGVCIVSQAEGVIMEADSVGCGLAVDTQRRRRRKRNEAISYASI